MTLVLMVAFCQDISSRADIKKKTDVFVATKYTGTTDLRNGFLEKSRLLWCTKGEKNRIEF